MMIAVVLVLIPVLTIIAAAKGKKSEAELNTPAEKALWERGASNQGYHYLGCAKTFALMGQAFAIATLQMMKDARKQ